MVRKGRIHFLTKLTTQTDHEPNHSNTKHASPHLTGHTLKQMALIIDAMLIKPEKHEFNVHELPFLLRYINMTGGVRF